MSTHLIALIVGLSLTIFIILKLNNMPTTAQHKTALGRILAAAGGLLTTVLTGLFNNTKKDFNNLTPDQQKAAIDAAHISQIIKTGYTKGEQWVLGQITAITGLPSDVAEQTVLSIAKDAGVNTTSVQEYLNHIADKIQSGITDNHYNALFEDAAKFATTYLTQGKLDWLSLGLGLVVYAYQVFVKK